MNVFSAQAGLKIEDKKDWRRESVTVGRRSPEVWERCCREAG